MGAPEKIAIATEGYRCPEFEPEKIAIATHGYRCEIPVDVVDPFGGGKGHGAVILEPSRRRREGITEDEQLALLAVLAIEETE